MCMMISKTKLRRACEKETAIPACVTMGQSEQDREILSEMHLTNCASAGQYPAATLFRSGVSLYTNSTSNGA